MQRDVITGRSILRRTRNVADKSCKENQNTHSMFNLPPTPAPENRAFYDLMWKKHGRVGEATGDNMTHAHSMLDT